MAICSVCGCKTDELDFIQGRLGKLDINMCSFCHKQAKAFDGDNEPTEGNLRWLSQVNAKQVPERSEDISAELKSLVEKYGTGATEMPDIQSRDVKVVNVVSSPQAEEALLERIEALEKQLRLMKRHMLIKTILEITLPIILGIILVLVIITSDAFESLSELYSIFA